MVAFLLLATGFFALIRFEISYGVAGGSLGGADVNTMPGTFWFFIWVQTLVALHFITLAIKSAWTLLHRSDQNNPARIIAIYWLVATCCFLALNLLALWSSFEMLSNAYNLFNAFEMPRKAIMGGLFFMVFGILCFIYYVFLFRTLIETFYPKAIISFQVFRKNK